LQDPMCMLIGTGVTVDDACMEEFNKIKLKHQYRYILYKIEGHKKIVVDEIGEKEKTYADFFSSITSKKEGEKDSPRYAVVDINYTTADGRPQEKLVFINYCPAGAAVKDKMVHSGSMKTLTTKLTGVAKVLQADGPEEIDEETVIKQCR